GEDLRQRADVDHDAVRVGAGERQDGAAVVVELVIVVVFEDGEAVLVREREQPGAPAGAEHGGGRVLVVRGDVEQPDGGPGADPGERGDVDAAGVDGHADQPRAGALEHGPRRAIAQRLDAHDVAGPDDRADGEVERHLAAARDHDVIGAGGD